MQLWVKVCAKGQCADEFCPYNQKCTSARTKTCGCKNGFVRNLVDDCIDIDECATNEHLCPKTSICENEKGSYVCRCPTGYEGANCTDIDECLKMVCGEKKKCVNNLGSYKCDCMEGFEKVNNSCIDTACVLNTIDCPNVCRKFLLETL